MVRSLIGSSPTIFRHPISRFLIFANSICGGYCKGWAFQSINGLSVGSLFLSFLFVISCGYFYLFPEIHPVIHSYETPESSISSSTCNLFEGRWVHDESYPLYNASDCPFAERGFNCLANGRKDIGYLRWRWKPRHCDIPRFDVYKTLEMLRNKRILFVGDSLSRTQWESMICLLITGVEDKKSVYEINGNKITKRIRHLGVRFSTYNFTIEFYRSVFLVQIGHAPKRAPKRVKSTIKLDQLDYVSSQWIDSDVLIFNTGHWWNPTKLFEIGCYFQVDGRTKLGMPINEAFRTAFATLRSWIEKKIDKNRTRVFLRTFESTHWSQSGKPCKVTRQPLTRIEGNYQNPFSDFIISAVKNFSVPATVLHVTPMGAFRSDAHVGIWSDNPLIPDCSHWCLPGVPDIWNEMLLSFLFP